VAAIFGANASGKSTILKALEHVRFLVTRSALEEPGRPIDGNPFRLGPPDPRRPFEAEVAFRASHSVFRYGFTITQGAVTREWLFETPEGGRRRVERLLFGRDGDRFDFGTTLAGPKAALAKATRTNSLFVSKAAVENHPALTAVYGWFYSSLLPVMWPDDRNVRVKWAMRQVASTPELAARVAEFLRLADLGVHGLGSAIGQSRLGTLMGFLPKDALESASFADVEALLEEQFRQPSLTHGSSEQTAVALPWESESEGTKELYAMAPGLLSALDAGRVVLVDEIAGSLHPLIVRDLLRTFQSAATNPADAQVIFTSHDTGLLGNYGGDGYVLDRDQVWFTQKDSSGAAVLVPLTDYRVRNSLDIPKAYIQGRLGGVPILTDTLVPPRPARDGE
jgi:energy-coupling factor transporter ATP-binding protein EcfA2